MKIKIQEIKDRSNDEERIVLRVLEDCNLWAHPTNPVE